MGKHTVEYDEIIGGCEASTILASSNGDTGKRLIMIANYDIRSFTFMIELDNEFAYEFRWLQEAIDKYNELL